MWSLVDALVAEHSAYLVHLVQPANYEAFEVQLRRNAEVEVAVKGVMVSGEGLGHRAGGNRHKHGVSPPP